MTTVDRILSLAKERGTKQSFLNNLIGGYRGKITDWKNEKSTPTEKEIKIIANYFNVSVDYLLGKTDDKLPSINLFEGVNMNTFNKQIYEQLTEEEREKVKEYILFLISQRANNEDNEK